MDSEPKQDANVSRKRLRRKRRQLVARELMQDFAQNSTLHGLRYIAERGLSLAEKVFWIVAFVTSLCLCAMLILKVWVKWQTSPIIVTLSEQLVSIGEVPFPSVTICPQSKIMQSAYNDSVMEEMENIEWTEELSQDEVLVNSLNMYEDLNLICERYPSYSRNYSDAKVIEHIFEVSPPFNQVFQRCTILQNWIPCYMLFEPVLTKEGVCFTMNSLAANEILRADNVRNYSSYLKTSKASKGWSSSGGYSTTDSDVYPSRGRSNFGHPDIDVILSEDPRERSKYCNTYNDGFKVYLQHPADMPQSSTYYYSIMPEETVSFAVKLNVLNTSSALREYAPETRQCYFPDERPLRYFLAYTANNCRLECLSNYTYKICGCVWFHMPHNHNSSICRSGLKRCVLAVLNRYAAEEGDPDSEVGRCRCFPSCNGIQYDAEILKSKFNVSRIFHVARVQHTDGPSSFFEVQYMHLEMYYKAPQFVSMRRSELFGLTDFLANCGGLLGLFLGFSFLSLVEIAYFLTLRLGCSLRRNTQQPESTAAKN